MKKSIYSIVLVFTWLTSTIQPVFANTENSAKITAVKNMYSFYNSENNYEIPRMFFTESLRNVMRRQDHYDAHHSIGEISDCTETGIFQISSNDYYNYKETLNSGIYTALANDNIKVELKEETQDGIVEETSFFTLKKENGSWKIDDMLYSDGTSFKQQANACLKRFNY